MEILEWRLDRQAHRMTSTNKIETDDLVKGFAVDASCFRSRQLWVYERSLCPAVDVYGSYDDDYIHKHLKSLQVFLRNYLI